MNFKLLLLFVLVFGMSGVAQNDYDQTTRYNTNPKGNIKEYEAMRTSYDLQSNRNISNRIAYFDDGTVATTATFMPIDKDPLSQASSYRGTGYNYFNGSDIGSMPNNRIESSMTGWPSIAPYGADGEIFVTHTGSGLIYYTRTNKGVGSWIGPKSIPAPDGHPSNSTLPYYLSWPRVVTSGSNHNIIHVVSCAQSISGESTEHTLFYSRSTDGENWTTTQMPAIGDLAINHFGPDDYSAAAYGNTVAFFLCPGNYMKGDAILVKSTNNGASWTKKVVWDDPLDGADWFDDFALFDTATHNCMYRPYMGSIALDKHGQAHIAMTNKAVTPNSTQGSYQYWYGLGREGVFYWNESMPAITGYNYVDASTGKKHDYEGLASIIYWEQTSGKTIPIINENLVGGTPFRCLVDFHNNKSIVKVWDEASFTGFIKPYLNFNYTNYEEYDEYFWYHTVKINVNGVEYDFSENYTWNQCLFDDIGLYDNYYYNDVTNHLYKTNGGINGNYNSKIGSSLSAWPSIAVNNEDVVAVAFSVPDLRRPRKNDQLCRTAYISYIDHGVKHLYEDYIGELSNHSSDELTNLHAISTPSNGKEFWFSYMTDNELGWACGGTDSNPASQTYGENKIFVTKVIPSYVNNNCNTVYNSFTANACESYIWSGIVYSASGDYTRTFSSYNGCDSIVTMHLTIGNPTSEFYKTACDYYMWNGHTYLYSGNYTETFESYQGCDSVVTLHLTINHSTSYSFNNVTCGPFNWYGQYITTEGTYTRTFTASNGCDSIVTMNVIFNYPEEGEVTKLVCGNSYESQGITYTQSGDYTQTFVTPQGCDSTVTLHLTLVPEFEPQITVTGNITACESGTATLTAESGYSQYLWSTGETTQSIQVSTAGYYWVAATDQNGCLGTSQMIQLGVSELVADAPSICMVGVENNHNHVVWNTLDDPAVAGYKIYRENNQADVYEAIGIVSSDVINVFEDTYSNPAERAFRYKVSAFDDCGAETPLSDFHKTTHLTINQGVGNSWNLIWSAYEGADFLSYRVYRGNTNNNLQLIQTMPSNLNSYTDFDNAGSAAFYQIEVVLTESCETGTKSLLNPRSNIVYNGESTYTDIYDSACDIYQWYGTIYTESGNYIHETLAASGINNVETLHLTINKADSPVIVGNLSIVIGESTTLTSSAAESYLWSTGETTQSISVSPTENTSYSVTITEANGCEATSEVVVTVTDGTGEFMGGVKVYPNPTKHMLNIEADGINNIRVTDIFGQTLFEANTISNNAQIDMSGYAVGCYFIQINTTQCSVIQKVIKK